MRIKSAAITGTFSQIHIEAARNSTDDFNLFHDKNKWQRIQRNPFGGPIVLGFQLECLLEYQMECYRREHQEDRLIQDLHLTYSNYQVTFANVVRPEEPISLEIMPSKLSQDQQPLLTNRLLLKGKSGAVLIGYKRESATPLFLPLCDLSQLPDLSKLPDRSYIDDPLLSGNQRYFLKRKYINTGNAKNFLSGSLAEQSDYFDELEGKIHFPETFPVSLTSCALLERALKEHQDLEADPMVYTSHSISIDRSCLKSLKSNDRLHILVKPQLQHNTDKGLGNSGIHQHIFHCFGLLKNNIILFRAEISLARLQEILANNAGG